MKITQIKVMKKHNLVRKLHFKNNKGVRNNKGLLHFMKTIITK